MKKTKEFLSLMGRALLEKVTTGAITKIDSNRKPTLVLSFNSKFALQHVVKRDKVEKKEAVLRILKKSPGNRTDQEVIQLASYISIPPNFCYHFDPI